MTKRNYFQELQGIASQSLGPVNTNPITAEDEITKAKRKQLQEMTALANNMYPEDATSRFDFWKSKMNVNDLPQGVRKDYWKTYESMHPEGNDGAKRDFVDVTKRELGMIPGMSQKEFFLRERVTQTPDWARKELEPLLAEVSTTVANANYNKAQQVYVSDLNTRVNAFLSQQQLDPDVAIDDHVNDMLKLEQMNMMDMASVVNGRVGILKGGKQFVPAFGLNSSDQIMSDAAVNPSVQEQFVVREIGLQPIKDAVTTNVYSSRKQIERQEVTSSQIAKSYLRDGKYSVDEWDKAFSMLPDMSMEDRLVLGLRGEIAAGRIKNEKQLAQTIYQAIDKYKGDVVNMGAMSDKTYMKLISEYEGLKTEAYYDETGKVWTIGKGTTTYPDGTPVKQGDKITTEQAEKYADDFVQKKILPKLQDSIPTWAEMNENQQAAIVSFAYNVGPNFYGRKGFETITKALSNIDNLKDVPAALALYKKSGGKTLRGLERRRAAEAQLFSTAP